MSTSHHSPNPVLRPVSMGVFPTSGSLQEALDLAKSQLPITDENKLTSLLMNYQNTLLQEIKKQDQTN